METETPAVGPLGRALGARRAHRGPHPLPVVLLAVGLFLGGSVAAALAASRIAHDRAASTRASLEATADQIASYVRLEIEHEADLVSSSAAYVSLQPQASSAELRDYVTASDAFHRYPELIEIGYASLAPPKAVTASSRPVGSGATGRAGGMVLGNCPIVAEVSIDSRPPFPRGLNVCAGGQLPGSLGATSASNEHYLALPLPTGADLVVFAPVAAPQSPRALRGWVGLAMRPVVLLDRALASRRGVSLALSNGAATVARAGAVSGGAVSFTASLPDGWHLTTVGTSGPVGIFSQGAAAGIFAGGVALSASLAALLALLALGRRRALRLVDERTAELRFQALHDPLTKLPNRLYVAERATQLIERNRSSDRGIAALYVDVDGFKSVNDTFGHLAGDRLLEAVSDRLRRTLREADTIGRLGGDEFIVLLDTTAGGVAPEAVAERMIEVLREPFTVEGVATPIVSTVSVGVAVGDRPDAEHLLRDADLALYAAKAAGRNRFRVFDDAMDASGERRFRLEFGLRSALASGQFHVVFQPIYGLDDLSLHGVEALLRWVHPTLGSIAPGEFIPLLEANGAIAEVGRFVLEEACAHAARWRLERPGLRVAVNVSGCQLDDDAIVADVRAALVASGLEPDALTIEVTETALMRDLERTAARLRALKQLGVEISIDDFGTGYSSLAYVQRFPVDSLKIDRSFVEAMTESSEADVILKTLVQLAGDLGARTIAEGVEHVDQLHYLRAEGVDEVQGFLLSKPLRVEQMEAMLGARAHDRRVAVGS